MMLLVQSRNFVMLFVALETVTVGLYILVSYYRSNPRTLEAGLKYLVMGALSSALLLFGIVLLYGVAGSPGLAGRTGGAMQFVGLSQFLGANPHNFMAAAGIVLVLSGLAFKIGAFPFQIWVPDVYQGAPTPVTALLAVASKAAGFVVLLVLVTEVFAAYEWLVGPGAHVHGRRHDTLRKPRRPEAEQREAPDRPFGRVPRGLHPPGRRLGRRRARWPSARFTSISSPT